MSAVALATRGYICMCNAATLVTGLAPDLKTEDLAPEINSRQTVLSPDLEIDTPVSDIKPRIK